MIGNVVQVCSSLSQEMEELDRGSFVSGHTQQTAAAMHRGLWHTENSLFDDCEDVPNATASEEFVKDWQQPVKLSRMNKVKQSWRLLQPVKCYQKLCMTDGFSADTSQEPSQLDSRSADSLKELSVTTHRRLSESHSVESQDSGVESVNCSELNSSSDSLPSFTDDVNDSILKTPSGFYERSLNVPNVRIPPLFDYPGLELSTVFSECESVGGTDGSVIDDWSRVASDVDSDGEGTEVSEQGLENDGDDFSSTGVTFSARAEDRIRLTTLGDRDVERNASQLYDHLVLDEHLVLKVLQKVLSDVTTLSLDSRQSTTEKSVECSHVARSTNPTATQCEDEMSHPGNNYSTKCKKSAGLNPLAPSFHCSASQSQRTMTPLAVVPLTGYGPSLNQYVAPQYWSYPMNWIPYYQVYDGTRVQSQQSVSCARGGQQRRASLYHCPMYVQPYYVVRPNCGLNLVYPVAKPNTSRSSATKRTAAKKAV